MASATKTAPSAAFTYSTYRFREVPVPVRAAPAAPAGRVASTHPVRTALVVVTFLAAGALVLALGAMRIAGLAAF